jgi:thiamine pyrophosphate-dependent acetolactate synthase large subunit-like protein
VILPNQNLKLPIVGVESWASVIARTYRFQLSENVYCGVRLGGMGVAIGSLIGTELADLV